MDYTKLTYSIRIGGEEIAEYDKHLSYKEMMHRFEYLRRNGCEYYVVAE